MTGRLSLGALALLTSGCLTYGREQGTETISERGPISRVEIDLDAGDVMINAARSAEGADGAMESRWSEAAPEVLHYVADGVLHVIGRCDELALACRTDLTLEVAPNVSVGVQTGMGDISVSGVAGDVEGGTENGNIELHDIKGVVFIESGDGAILGDGLAGTIVDGRTTAGDVELEITAFPDRVVGRTDSGNVMLTVPAGAYRVQADATNGDLVLGGNIREDATSGAVIVAETRNGDVTIESGPAATPQTPEEPTVSAPEEPDQPADHERAAPQTRGGRRAGR